MAAITDSLASIDKYCEVTSFDYKGAVENKVPDPTKTSNPEGPVRIKYVFEVPDADGRMETLTQEDWDRKRRDGEESYRTYPIVLRRFVKSANEINYIATNVEIHSDRLRLLFQRIAVDYRDLRLFADPIVIPHPYHCLFFLRNRLKEELQTAGSPTGDSRLEDEIRLLIDFIESKDGLEETIAGYEALVPNGKITFDLLWTLFPPWELLYWHGDYYERVFLTEYVHFEKTLKGPVLVFSLFSSWHNGKAFGIRREPFVLKCFRGVVSIDKRDLHVVPFSRLPEAEQTTLKERLLLEGQKCLRLQRAEHTVQMHKGIIWTTKYDRDNMLLELNMSNVVEHTGRVVVDSMAVREYVTLAVTDEYFISTSVANLKDPGTVLRVTGDDNPSTSRCSSRSTSPFPRYDRRRHRSHRWGQNRRIPSQAGDLGGVEGTDDDEITEDDIIIHDPRIIAFSLERKIWCGLRVRDLTEVSWFPQPFDFLELNPDKKELVRRLVHNFDTEDGYNGFDDVVPGKGKGLVFLLYGKPGLGKTLTAETIAEHTNRPLYHITAGDLNTSQVDEMATQLRQVFQLGWRWGAVVLLDEADVLMSQRIKDEVQRNSMVAVLLRLIEYYKGILFLTTNRKDEIDEAFLSRIHIAIPFDDLTKQNRLGIWKGQLSKSEESMELDGTWSDEALDILADLEINGREIRNIIRTTYGWAKKPAGSFLLTGSHREAGKKLIGVQDVLTILEMNLPPEKAGTTIRRLRELLERQSAEHRGKGKRAITGMLPVRRIATI